MTNGVIISEKKLIENGWEHVGFFSSFEIWARKDKRILWTKETKEIRLVYELKNKTLCQELLNEKKI